MSEGQFLVLGLLISAALGALLLLAIKQRRKLREKSAETRRLGQRIHRLEEEVHQVIEFLTELPVISGELYSPTDRRKLPEMLLRIVLRSFQPERVVVLLRRRNTMARPDLDHELVVVACEPPSSQVAVGSIVEVGKGELGFVAKVNRSMDRRELDQRSSIIGSTGGSEIGAGKFDFVAALRDSQKNLGVLALARPRLHQAYYREFVELIARMAGQALRQATELSQIRSVADLDGLTGILNKRVLTFRLGELVFEAEEKSEPLAVFLFDIDNFKHYNDRNGHLAGDRLLRLLARLVGDVLRADTVFGRFGGEEFLVVLPGCSAVEARVVAGKIRHTVEEFDFPFRRHQPLGAVTISGGIACYPQHGSSSTALLQAADEALYLAKDAGRNRVHEPSGAAG